MLINVVVRNSYHDSVFLMSIASKVKALAGVREVSCVMGTEENQRILDGAGLLGDNGKTAGPNDLVVAVLAETAEVAAEAVRTATDLLARKPSGTTGAEAPPRTLQGALERQPASNLALISVPGRYARVQAEEALRRGLHVFLFSDNVSVADEVALKTLARPLGLLVMGPDCGTALLSGAAVGFANRVRRGNIGIVAAAGTGLQEVSCLIHRLGGGVSQGIGTGGRDLTEAVGGMTMLQGMAMLEEDPQTEVIVLVSKPPARSVAEKILATARTGRKSYVVGFVGSTGGPDQGNLAFAPTLAETAAKAVGRAGISGACMSTGMVQSAPEENLLAAGLSAPGRPEPGGHALLAEASAELTLPDDICLDGMPQADPEKLAAGLAPGRRFLRGLYSGGTLCYEAEHLLRSRLPGVFSNISHDPARRLADPKRSQGHTLLDLGDDEFTVGRPHPMIDFTLRNDRIVREASDPGTAVILIDVVLGYGSHADPAAALAPALAEAGRVGVPVVAALCGTDLDPQGFSRQMAALRASGAIVCAANAHAVRFAAGIAAIAGRS